jgi:hypothetical protein
VQFDELVVRIENRVTWDRENRAAAATHTRASGESGDVMQVRKDRRCRHSHHVKLTVMSCA